MMLSKICGSVKNSKIHFNYIKFVISIEIYYMKE